MSHVTWHNLGVNKPQEPDDESDIFASEDDSDDGHFVGVEYCEWLRQTRRQDCAESFYQFCGWEDNPPDEFVDWLRANQRENNAESCGIFMDYENMDPEVVHD